MRASKRQIVVDTATRLFSLHGFHPVGVERIIEESGVAKMTLYRHFTGKDALIKAVLQQRHTAIIGSLKEELAARATPETQLRGFFDWYGKWFASREFAGCLFERALAEFGTANPEISTVAVRYRQTVREWLQRILSDLVPKSQAVQLSAVFVMLLDGATVEARACNDSSAAKRAWSAAEVLLARAQQGARANRPC